MLCIVGGDDFSPSNKPKKLGYILIDFDWDKKVDVQMYPLVPSSGNQYDIRS